MKHAQRLLGPMVAVLVAACISLSPTTTPIPGTSPTPSPPPLLTPTTSSAPTPSPTTLPSPTPTPTQVPTPTFTLSPGATLAEQLSAVVQSTLDGTRTAREIPGIGASIIFPDGSRWDSGSGDAVLDERSAGADTPFSVGSITKTFVAALILQLAEEGTLSLDDPLARWMPRYPMADQITLRHLLGHTAGLANYFEHPTYTRLVYGRPSHEWTPREILAAFDAPPYFAPGAGYRYSNTGFILLGMVAEDVTGRSLGEELAQRFFAPLGMAETYFQNDDLLSTDAAHGYLTRQGALADITDESGYLPSRSAATVAWAAGAVVGSARDMATWGDVLYGGDLLEPDSLAAMTDYTAAVYARGLYGLGTRTRLVDGRRMFGHTGSLRGFVAAMWHFPDTDVTIAVLTNRGRGDANPIVDALAAITLPAVDDL